MKRIAPLATFCLFVFLNTQTTSANFFQNLEIFRPKNTIHNISYGSDTLQKLDVYLPKSNHSNLKNQKLAPILFIIHGGAWSIGDKSHQGLIQHKATYWNQQGWVVISVNYRLVPKVTVQQQTQDIADALNFVQKNASNWQADNRNIVIMGHSAGAHLVTLLPLTQNGFPTFPNHGKQRLP